MPLNTLINRFSLTRVSSVGKKFNFFKFNFGSRQALLVYFDSIKNILL
jgi:hypothetical protein